MEMMFGIRLGAVAGLLALSTCGRTPVWLPCDGLVEHDAPALSCEHPSCAAASATRIEIGADNALIVQDRSCSMSVYIDGRTKWSRAVEAVTAAVAHPDSRQIRWGLTLFPDRDTGAFLHSILVPVGDDQHGTIVSLLTAALDQDHPQHPHQPGEACFTNLDEAIRDIAGAGAFEGLSGSQQLILITDGLASSSIAEEELRQMHANGTSTFVVGFGEAVHDDNLEALAEAGGVPAPGQTGYYQAGLDDLTSALQQVIRGLRCSQRLILPTDQLDRLLVRWSSGEFVPADPTGTNGWQYDIDTETITFSGAACESLLRGEVDAIELALDCG